MFATAALMVTAACSSDGLTPTEPLLPASQFSATVAGAIQAPLAGKAALLTDSATMMGTTPLPPVAALGLLDKDGAVVAFQWYGVALPPVGSYNVGLDGNNIAMTYDGGTGAAGNRFDGTSGTITVTSANSKQVAGTFTVTALAPDTGARISVTGSFTAQIVAQSDAAS